MARKPEAFYTIKGYDLLSAGRVTSAMEDYLEMLARLSPGGGAVRPGDLSAVLHVKAPSVTKMIQRLAKDGLVAAPKYGDIVLTERGRALGEYLLHRHGVVQRFLALLNGGETELEQVEKLEHFITRETVENLERLCRRLEEEGAAGQ